MIITVYSTKKTEYESLARAIANSVSGDIIFIPSGEVELDGEIILPDGVNLYAITELTGLVKVKVHCVPELQVGGVK